ncbi:MAG TPA: SBBP repeat-containing protein [Polyangiales bacterium]
MTCTNTTGGRTCGACPQDYHGDGDTGCIPFWLLRIRSRLADLPSTASADDTASDIALDGSGNIHVTGVTAGNLNGVYDRFVATYDRSRHLQWTSTLSWVDAHGSRSPVQPAALTSDSGANVYVAGRTYDGRAALMKLGAAGEQKWIADPGLSNAWTHVATDTKDGVYVVGSTFDPNTMVRSSIVAKIDSTGQTQWTRDPRAGASGGGPTRVASDANGNVYVCGWTADSLDGATPQGGYDVFIAKYDRDGQNQWLRLFGSSGDDTPVDMAIDASGNTYVLGTTKAASGAMATPDAFLLKCGTVGDLQWMRPIAVGSSEVLIDLAADANGNAYVMSSTNAVSATNTNVAYVSVAAYDGKGAQRWTQPIGPRPFDQGGCMTVDADANVYVATNVHVGDYQPQGGDVSPWYFGDDVFIYKLDSAGNQL